MPFVTIIHGNNILKEFPGQTEGDLYLWMLDHQHYLAETWGNRFSRRKKRRETFLSKE
jgi:hypothetical protein